MIPSNLLDTEWCGQFHSQLTCFQAENSDIFILGQSRRSDKTGDATADDDVVKCSPIRQIGAVVDHGVCTREQNAEHEQEEWIHNEVELRYHRVICNAREMGFGWKRKGNETDK